MSQFAHPSNDNFANRLVIHPASTLSWFAENTWGASSEVDEPQLKSTAAFASVWFAFSGTGLASKVYLSRLVLPFLLLWSRGRSERGLPIEYIL